MDLWPPAGDADAGLPVRRLPGRPAAAGVPLVPPVLRALWDALVREVRQAPRVLRVREALRDFRGLRAPSVPRARWALRELRALQELQELREPPAPQVPPARQALRE